MTEGTYLGSHADQHDNGFFDVTRKDPLRHIENWAEDSEGKCISWVSGTAGTNKATMARMLAEKECLGAIFLFKRGDKDTEDQGHAK